jgi:hypothetical protein
VTLTVVGIMVLLRIGDGRTIGDMFGPRTGPSAQFVEVCLEEFVRQFVVVRKDA